MHQNDNWETLKNCENKKISIIIKIAIFSPPICSIIVVVGCENHRQKKSHFMHIVVSFKLIKLRLKNYHWNALIELILYDVIGTCRRVNLPQIPKILCNNLSMKKILLKIPEDCQTTFLPHMHIVWKEK